MIKTIDDAPLFTREQLDYLQAVFPDKIPRGDLAGLNLSLLQGQMKVLDHIGAIITQQESSDNVPSEA